MDFTTQQTVIPASILTIFQVYLGQPGNSHFFQFQQFCPCYYKALKLESAQGWIKQPVAGEGEVSVEGYG